MARLQYWWLTALVSRELGVLPSSKPGTAVKSRKLGTYVVRS